jgi:hypothetical protein
MSRTIIILDDTPDGRRLGLAMLAGIPQAESKSVAVATFPETIIVSELAKVPDVDAIYCPLTLDLPTEFKFWGRDIGQTCRRAPTLSSYENGVKSRRSR